jgi:hypothetical protein
MYFACINVFKGANSKGSFRCNFVSNIEPRASPAFGGVHWQDERILLCAPRDKGNCLAGAKGPVVFNIGSDAEEELEEIDPWRDPEVALAKCSVSSYGDQTVWQDVVKLQTIKLEEVAEKVRWRHAEASLHM